MRSIGVTGKTGGSENEQKTDGRQRQDAHQQVGNDVDQVGPFLAGHNAH